MQALLARLREQQAPQRTAAAKLEAVPALSAEDWRRKWRPKALPQPGDSLSRLDARCSSGQGDEHASSGWSLEAPLTARVTGGARMTAGAGDVAIARNQRPLATPPNDPPY